MLWLANSLLSVAWQCFRARLRPSRCSPVSHSAVLASHVLVSSLSSFFLSLSSFRPPVPMTTYVVLPPPPSLLPPPPPASLCSGDNPEQRSAASWQRPPTVLALSGDHQRDLHPRACAKLAGGLPQSHTHHHGVCVATHVPASSPPPAVFPPPFFALMAKMRTCHLPVLSEYSHCQSLFKIHLIFLNFWIPGELLSLFP